MTAPFTPAPPEPTRCPHCEHLPLAAEAVCRECGKSRWEPIEPPGRDEHQLEHPRDRSAA